MKDTKERMSRRGTLPAHTDCVFIFMLFHVSIKTRQQNQMVRRKSALTPERAELLSGTGTKPSTIIAATVE